MAMDNNLDSFVSGGGNNRRQREELDYFDNNNNNDDFMEGGIKKNKGSVVVEGEYDSFTIYESSVGEKGGRYISKTPYSAANKAANRLFKATSSNSLTFILQKTTNGSNKRFYSYTATRTKLSKPQFVFKRDENGNKIISTAMGQVLKLNAKKQILNAKGKKQVYDSKDKSKTYNVESFDYVPYLIKEINMIVDIKSAEVPPELKEQQKNVKKSKVDAEKQKEKAQKKKEKEAEKKAKDQAKKEAKRAKEQAKKAKEQAKKEAKRAKEQAKKAKKAKKSKKGSKSPRMMFGGGSSCNSCSLY